MELSLDTASDRASVAVSRQGEAIAELTWLCRTNHSVELLPSIDQALKQAGSGRGELEAVFVCRGPGSYGGLRAGLSFGMALAAGLGIEVLGIGRLEVDAYQHAAWGGPVCAVHRAGRGELAWAAYEDAADGWRELIPPQLASPDDIIAAAPAAALFCGEVDADLAARLCERDRQTRVAGGAAAMRRAGFLAELGWRRYAAGERSRNGFIEPLYLREPLITPSRKSLGLA